MYKISYNSDFCTIIHSKKLNNRFDILNYNNKDPDSYFFIFYSKFLS